MYWKSKEAMDGYRILSSVDGIRRLLKDFLIYFIFFLAGAVRMLRLLYSARGEPTFKALYFQYNIRIRVGRGLEVRNTSILSKDVFGLHF